jgi:hypothetical protein
LDWKSEYQEHLEVIAEKATKAPGDTLKILSAALDAFFGKPEQKKFKYAPSGLAFGFDTYAAEVLEQEKEEAKAHKIAEKDAEYDRVKAEYEDRADQERKRKRQQREANGEAVLGNNLELDPASLKGLLGQS